MAGGNYSNAFPSVTIDGNLIEDRMSVEFPPAEGSEVGTLMAAASRGLGHQYTTVANNVRLPLSVASPSDADHSLEVLHVTKVTVPFEFAYEDDSELPDGHLIGFSSANCKISRTGSMTFADDVPGREYTVNCIGFTMSFKNKPSITVDERGNVSVG